MAAAIAVGLVLIGCTDDAVDDTDATAGEPVGTAVRAGDDTLGDDQADDDQADDDQADDDQADDDQGDDGSESTVVESLEPRSHVDTVASLTQLLPADTRFVFAVDLGGVLADTSAVTDLLGGEGVDPALSEVFGALGGLAGVVDSQKLITTALLVQSTDAASGQFLLARLESADFGEVMGEPAPEPAGTYGPASRDLYLDAAGNHVAQLPDGVVVVGTLASVESVVDLADGGGSTGESALTPFLGDLVTDADLSFALGLPALYGDVAPDRTLRGAVVMSGAFDLDDDGIVGEMAFHTSNAVEFVDAYNALNGASTAGDEPIEEPLELAAPIADGLDRVVVTLPRRPFDASFDEVRESRNIFKKLFVGMDAHDYAEGVDDRSTRAWLDFRVRSEADRDEPPSPASVYIRWEFRDQAAIDAFEQNELPAGFRLAPTRFLETDDPDGEYFLALNLYNAGGGSIVGGARAEWDVFVHGPVGADPDAGERPRFMVVEALAEEVSADPGNLLTPAEPVSHELVDQTVVSSVAKFVDGVAVQVFDSSFPVPRRGSAAAARFTRQMAIGNDYIYWEHGVSDRVFYNATTFNHDAYFVDIDELEFTDLSRWAQYLKPTMKDAVYYENSLEYVASPMANLDSEYLDITPEWLAELVAFTTNGHQTGLMRNAVEQLFRGQADAFVERRIANETPSTYYHFEITDPSGLEAAIGLPPGHSLAPTTLVEGGSPAYYLTLSVLEFDDALEGTRAEWSVYTDDGSDRPPRLMVVDLMTADIGFDPVSIINLPSDVRHDLVDGVVITRLWSGDVSFEASFDTAETVAEELTMDWIEAGDTVCSLNAVCDKFYYDAETLDVAVHRPATVSVEVVSTPWNDFIDTTPAMVFYRDNAQQYAVMRWYDLDVVVDELPFTGLENPTHVITGSGSLAGTDTDLVDSQYTYTGDAIAGADRLTFAIDQEVDNALGAANIFTTGAFDLRDGTGTQTVVDCVGPALLCSDIETGSTAFYTAQDLDVSDPDELTWIVDVVVDLGGSFGVAESQSTFAATRTS